MTNLGIYLALAAAFVLQLFSHFVPWAKFLKLNELPRVVAYTIGNVTIGAVYTAWLLSANRHQEAAMFWAILIVSGAGVVLGYLLSEWIDGQKAKADKAKGDAIISALIDEHTHEREETR